MARRWVFYPFLLAIYPILFLYAQNYNEAHAHDLIIPMVVMLGLSSVVFIAAWPILRDAARAGLIAVVAIAVFVTIGQISGWIDGFLESLSMVWVYREVHLWTPLSIGLEVALAVAAIYGITCWKTARAATPFINAFALVLLVIPLFSVIRHRLSEPKMFSGPRAAFATTRRPNQPPDVYYIILDGFARFDVMKEQFGFDYQPILERLERKGFYVARGSTSNYCQTPLSLSSSLNSSYLNALFAPDSDDKSVLNEWIGDGAVVRTFKSMGYRYVSYASGFSETEQTKADDYRTIYPRYSEFQRLLISHTPLESLFPQSIFNDSYSLARSRIKYVFDDLPTVATLPEPTFTFAHILSPHPPFIFGADGSDVSPRGRLYFLNDGDVYMNNSGNQASYLQGYRGQAEYLLGKVEKTIDAILAASPEPPVIILQSDHGSGLNLMTDSAKETDMHERMCILNAIYIPGGKYGELYQKITPVNSFRAIFNTCFNGHLEYLPDRNYFSTWSRPFMFDDVSDRVEKKP